MPQKRSEQRRREILDAALECFASKGFAASTMADIRERAGASTGSIYHHFKSKEQLAAELYLEGVRAVQQRGLAALLAHENTERGVCSLVEAYLDWVAENRPLAAFLFAMRHADFLQAVEQELDRIQHDAIDAATDWFRSRMLAGELPNLTPDVMRAILYGPASHFATQWASSRADVEIGTAKRQLSRAVWAALTGMRAVASASRVLVMLLALTAACSDAAPARPSHASQMRRELAGAATAQRSAVVPTDSSDVAAVAPPDLPGQPIVLVTDPVALARVARAGGDFGMLITGHPAAGASNAELAQSAALRSISEPIAADLAAIARDDPRAGVGIRGHAHRLFDLRWLSASIARFELVAVANRIDRRAFHDGGCGEPRLIYRLAYDRHEHGVRHASRLPMTAVAELSPAHEPSDPTCKTAAQRWLAPPGLAGAALGDWLVSTTGPLGGGTLARARIAQLAINLQTVRWPSAVRPDLGGHAEYVLRAFSWDDARARYRPRKLENTPDVPRLLRDHTLRDALHAWISAPENLARVDGATADLPDEFLAESVVSVTPRGLARLQNRPFRQLLAPEELGGLDFAQRRHARSPEALLRRLDDLTCNGCHQSRSIAGFHVLGEDGPDTAAGNALASAVSPHALAEVERRKALLLGLARGERVDDVRPFAERAGARDEGYGAHCGLGDPGFADWRCAPGLHCDAYEAAAGESTVGVCLPDAPRVGDPCQPGRVQAHPDPHRDRVREFEQRGCEHICEATRVGFPGGMCAASCDRLPDDATCGGIAILTDFNNCLARREPFAECVAQHVRPAGLRACSDAQPCRDDYICARTAAGTGACLPPYFVFQLRVDGHL
jgi:AcrR family transcriptional regulator